MLWPCFVCRTPFEKRNSQLVCSHKCKQVRESARMTERYLERHRNRVSPECPECKAQIPFNARPDRIYCSEKCKLLARREKDRIRYHSDPRKYIAKAARRDKAKVKELQKRTRNRRKARADAFKIIIDLMEGSHVDENTKAAIRRLRAAVEEKCGGAEGVPGRTGKASGATLG